MGTSEMSGKPDKMLEISSNGLVLGVSSRYVPDVELLASAVRLATLTSTSFTFDLSS